MMILNIMSILVSACAANGIAAFTGDGTNPDVFKGAAAAIKKNHGQGIPTVKPWNIETIREKMDMVQEAGAKMVAMDIDAAGLPFLKNLNPPAGSKTVEQLSEIVNAAGIPFIVKGIMTVAGAKKAFDAGASAIIVSNHGGRVLDQDTGNSGSVRADRRMESGKNEDICRWRYSSGNRYFQGAGDGSRCCPDCKTICTGGVRWSRRRSKALY